MLHGLAVLRSRTGNPVSVYPWTWSIQVKQVSGRGLDGPGHYSLGVGARVGTLTKHGHKEVLHLASYVGAVVPHLPILPWKGHVEERHRPASVTPAAGVVGGRWSKT